MIPTLTLMPRRRRHQRCLVLICTLHMMICSAWSHRPPVSPVIQVPVVKFLWVNSTNIPQHSASLTCRSPGKEEAEGGQARFLGRTCMSRKAVSCGCPNKNDSTAATVCCLFLPSFQVYVTNHRRQSHTTSGKVLSKGRLQRGQNCRIHVRPTYPCSQSSQ